MLKLFEPQTKVQKNRQIIRKTDARMAKYSRRGVVANFLVYTLCLFFSQEFIDDHEKLAIVLTVGLYLINLLRAYLLFRFEAIYPRAPAAWRNKYFIATMAGAAWWGFILSSVTLALEMQDIAPLMWLYTVIFFSSTAHAFAPYQRFLSIYQFLGIVPAACTALFIGELEGIAYGGFFLIFYWILNHQCELMGRSYWEHLEANYALERKTESLEEERRDTRASVSLSKDYLELLVERLHDIIRPPVVRDDAEPPRPTTVASLKAELEKLHHNVADFHKITSKNLHLDQRTFNVRHYLQALVARMVNKAEGRHIELDSALSPVLPSRLRADALRLGQIVQIMLECAIAQSEEAYLLLEVEFVREFEDAGELHVTVLRHFPGNRRVFFQDHSDSHNLRSNLDLVLAKGMAEFMDGALETADWQKREAQCLRLRVPVSVAEVDSRPEYHRLEYKGRSLLLIQPSGRWLDQKRLELDTMGFDVTTAQDYKKAYQELQAAVSGGKAIESVVYSIVPQDSQASQFCNELLAHKELRYTHQFVIGSATARQLFIERLQQSAPQVHFVQKPSGIFEFEIAVGQVFDLPPEADKLPQGRLLWLAIGRTQEDKSSASGADLSAAVGYSIDKFSDLRQALKALQDKDYKLIIVERIDDNSAGSIEEIRRQENKNKRETLLPVIAVCSYEHQLPMLEAGADHCIELESVLAGDTSALQYWIKGRNH